MQRAEDGRRRRRRRARHDNPMGDVRQLTPVQAFDISSVRIDALQLPGATTVVLDGTPSRSVHLCNAYTVALSRRDAKLKHSLDSGSLNLPDGTPLIWIARRLGLSHMRVPVRGPDLMESCIETGVASGTKHFLYGSTPEVLENLRAGILARWPEAIIAGDESPPFGPISDEALAESVAQMTAVEADVVWVGMGTPKQDYLVERMAAIGPHTYVAIGAAFDFIAGTKQRAPQWIQEHGLEWLFRLVTEPRRLWKRYLLGNLQFVWGVLRDRPTLRHR